jgi:sulfite exporter TauE/SafE
MAKDGEGWVIASEPGRAILCRLGGSQALVFAFGLGALPVMLAFCLAGSRIQFAFRFKLQRLIPASLALVGALLLARGLALGIPYVSPKLPAQPSTTSCCH